MLSTSLHPLEQSKSLRARPKALTRTPTEPLIVDNSVSINHLSVMVDSIGANIPSTSRAPNGSGITRQYAMYLEFDGDWDGGRDCEGRMKLVKEAQLKAGKRSIGE
jgi:hypothetical protein